MKKSGKEKSKASADDDQDMDEFEANAAMDTSELKGDTKFDDEEIVLISNAFLFFFAGFDTSSTGFGFVCHKLCLHEEKNINCLMTKKMYHNLDNGIKAFIYNFYTVSKNTA